MGQETEVKGGRLVVVDDEPNVARVISTLFTREGWNVQTFQNPVEALGAITSNEVDVVVTDLSMPEMTGIQLLEGMRSRGCEAPVLVVTAHGTVGSAVEAMKLGAFDYLCKPFELE